MHIIETYFWLISNTVITCLPLTFSAKIRILKVVKKSYISGAVAVCILCNDALRCNTRIWFVFSVGLAHRGSKSKWWGPWFFSSEAVEAVGAHLLLKGGRYAKTPSSLFLLPTTSPLLLFTASVF